MHCGSNIILKVRFFGTPCTLKNYLIRKYALFAQLGTLWDTYVQSRLTKSMCSLHFFNFFPSHTTSLEKGRCGNMWGRWDPLDTWLQLTFTWSHASFSALLWVSVQGIQRPSQNMHIAQCIWGEPGEAWHSINTWFIWTRPHNHTTTGTTSYVERPLFTCSSHLNFSNSSEAELKLLSHCSFLVRVNTLVRRLRPLLRWRSVRWIVTLVPIEMQRWLGDIFVSWHSNLCWAIKKWEDVLFFSGEFQNNMYKTMASGSLK